MRHDTGTGDPSRQGAKRVRPNKEYFFLEKDGIFIIGELRDPKVREEIRKNPADQLARKGRPLADFLASLPPRKRTRRST